MAGAVVWAAPRPLSPTLSPALRTWASASHLWNAWRTVTLRRVAFARLDRAGGGRLEPSRARLLPGEREARRGSHARRERARGWGRYKHCAGGSRGRFVRDLAQWLGQQKMEHVRSAPYHPQTQGKIERWHQSLKNRILLEHYYLPGDLERQVAAFVAHYNHARYHESLDNLTPADVYFGRAEAVLLERERIKRQTIANRRLQHQLHAA